MITIILHGAIRAAMGGLREFECEARTPAEAVNALFSQIKPEAPAPGRRWVLSVAGCNNRQALYSPIQGDTLHITPALMGAGGRGGWVQIAIAVVIIAVAWWNPLGWSSAAIMATYAFAASMAIGGVIQLIMPAPKLNSPDTSTADNPENSRYLGAARNTVDSGTRIPIGYGRHKVAGHYIHFDMEAEPAAIDGQPPTAETRSMFARTGSVV